MKHHTHAPLFAVAAALIAACFATTPPANAQPAPRAEPFDQLAERSPFDYPLPSGEPLTFDPAIPTPADVIGHRPGEHFTRHHHIVAYMNALAEASPRVTVETYGTSHQRRPLLVVTITSPDNHRNLDTILERNRALADAENTSNAEARRIIERSPAIAWLSSNVHGNEPSCAESAIQLAYTLAASTNDDIQAWLDNTVVVVDPVLNPDGRERYIAFFDNAVGAHVDPDPHTTEHREPWPTGRSNHYLFDLNRDWAWLSQPESASRLAIYQRYLPHFHIDIHEQGYHSPYFFGAGDKPYNTIIPQGTKDAIEIYGDHNAVVFDTIGLPFATRERFDYLYPGYGKVMPVYHGAVGMLSEQGGHSRGGLAITVDEHAGPDPLGGYTLTLRERTRNHFLTNMSYVQTTAENRQQQLQRFRDFHTDATGTRPPTTLSPHADDAERINEPISIDMPRAYAVLPDNDPDALRALHHLLTSHGVTVTQLTREARTNHALAYFPPYASAEPETLPEGTWIINAEQSKGLLTRVFMDRTTAVEDAATYDITAWAAPLMYALDARELFQPAADFQTQPLDRNALHALPEGAFTPAPDNNTPQPPRAGGVAWIVPNDRLSFPTALSLAARHNVFARLTAEPFTQDNRTHPARSLLIHKHRNTQGTLDAFLAELATRAIPAFALPAGIPTQGNALGNNANRRFIHPRVMLLTGTPFSSLSAGHTWHLLDHQTPIDHNRVNATQFPPANLDDYNVIVLPSSWGSLSGTLDPQDRETLKDWIRAGGTLVAINRSARWANTNILELDPEQNTTPPGPNDNYSDQEEHENNDTHRSFDERQRQRDEDRVPGAVLHAIVDTTHPVASGVNASLALHMFTATPMPVADNGYVVARFNATTYTHDNRSPFFRSSEPPLHPYTAGMVTVERVQDLYAHATAPQPNNPPAADPLVLAGYISHDNARKLAGTPAVTHHRLGGGNVICFASDPTNRAMNKGAMRLLTNAITMSPSLATRLQPLGEHDEHTQQDR